MSTLVCNTASLECSMGSAPSALTVLPDRTVLVANQPAATVADHQPNVNVMPFGLCRSTANPQVAAATAAAGGALTPQPCVPVIPAPWSPGSATVAAAHQGVLTKDATCQCQWAGVISVTAPAQQDTDVGG